MLSLSDNIVLGENMRFRIKEYAQKQGWRLSEIARQLRMPLSNLSAINAGKRSVSLHLLARIADLLHRDVSELFVDAAGTRALKRLGRGGQSVRVERLHHAGIGKAQPVKVLLAKRMPRASVREHGAHYGRKSSPKLYVIAGPNGAGKTTFAEKFLPNYAECFEFVNADLIAKGLSPFTPSWVALKAGKLLLEQIEDCSRRKADFAFETTLAGKAYVNLLKKLKSSGYELHLFFLWLPTVQLALARIADRVQKGGHDIPEPDVRRRFVRGLENLFYVYGPIFDTWSIFDNATGSPEQIFRSEQGVVTIHNKLKYEIISKQAG